MDSIKTMVFPVEVPHREFDGKLLLALTACERGWQVMLANQQRTWKGKVAWRDNAERKSMLLGI
jgi:hypothetical protein